MIKAECIKCSRNNVEGTTSYLEEQKRLNSEQSFKQCVIICSLVTTLVIQIEEKTVDRHLCIKELV